jgi:NitT/TauT family transport system ATP-binding protein
MSLSGAATTTTRVIDRAPGRGSRAPSVTLTGVSKRYGSGQSGVTALQDVTLAVAPGSFVCLVGASGCGKTTLLNLVAGLDRPTVGSVVVGHDGGGSSVGDMAPAMGAGPGGSQASAGPGTTVGMLFQDSALFPWLTVAANVELPLRLRGVGKAERQAMAGDLLERVHLGGFGKKRPHELSGGMRQRAALARALAQDAGLLLMDEPFGALDAITRDLLHDELESLWIDRGFSVVFVTHNVREAARLGDRIVLLTSRPGRVAAVHPVDLPRPRRIDSPEVARLAATVTDQLRAEVGRHGG